jgi:hypothetical protein
MRVDCEPLNIWNRFQEIFRKTAEESDPRELVDAWKSPTNRTKFIKIFVGQVASALGLTLERELWKVDFALSVVSTNDSKVPVIFIESENDIRDVNRDGGEVRKLYCHSAPLKVLITVAEWDETPSVWKGQCVRHRYLSRWQDIIRAHADVWPHRGLFGVIVGEWVDLGEISRLRFYANAIEPDGALLYPVKDAIIFERQPILSDLAQSL